MEVPIDKRDPIVSDGSQSRDSFNLIVSPELQYLTAYSEESLGPPAPLSVIDRESCSMGDQEDNSSGFRDKT